MPDIDITRDHALGLDGARAAARAMQDDLSRKFGLTGSWTGDTLHFQRPGVSGSLAVTATTLHLSVTLGFLLRAMKGSIESSVRHELDHLFPGARKA
ncbi:MAG: polyhydroxyalkanoic acid system family protein [Usitatibacter sp.]